MYGLPVTASMALRAQAIRTADALRHPEAHLDLASPLAQLGSWRLARQRLRHRVLPLAVPPIVDLVGPIVAMLGDEHLVRVEGQVQPFGSGPRVRRRERRRDGVTEVHLERRHSGGPARERDRLQRVDSAPDAGVAHVAAPARDTLRRRRLRHPRHVSALRSRQATPQISHAHVFLLLRWLRYRQPLNQLRESEEVGPRHQVRPRARRYSSASRRNAAEQLALHSSG